MSSTPQQRRPIHHSRQQFSTFDVAYPSPPWSDEGTTQSAVPMYDYEMTCPINNVPSVLPYPPSPITRCSSLACNSGYSADAQYYDPRNLSSTVQYYPGLSTGPFYQNSRQPQQAQIVNVDPRDVLRTTASLFPQTNIKRSSLGASSPGPDSTMQTRSTQGHETPILTSSAINTSVMHPKPIHPRIDMNHLHFSEHGTQHEDVESFHATPDQSMCTLEPLVMLRSLKIESVTPSLQDPEHEDDTEAKAEPDTKKDIHIRRRQWTEADLASFVCTTCTPPRGFVRKWNLTKHLETHEKERDRPFKCSYPQCVLRFRRAHDLQRHVDGVHLKSKRFRCSYCNRGFPRKDSLQRHESKGCLNQGHSTGSTSSQHWAPFIDDAYARRRKKVHRRNAIKNERDQSLTFTSEEQQRSTTVPPVSYEDHHLTGVNTVWEDLTPSGMTYHVPELQSSRSTNDTSMTYWPAQNHSAGYSLLSHDQAVAEESVVNWSTILDAYSS